VARRTRDGNRVSAKAARAPEWAIVAVLKDGQRLYYQRDEPEPGATGRPLEHWSPYSSDALLFTLESDAASIIAPWAIGAGVAGYEIQKVGRRPPGLRNRH